MGRPKKVREDGTEAEEVEAPPVKVRFLKLWSSDRGAFPEGSEAELPDEIATSLLGEGVVEVL